MIKEREDGRWIATCDICFWKAMERGEKNAENRLKNHISIVHNKGRKLIEKKPSQIPSPISEQS